MEEARRQRAMDCPFADPARQARSARAFAAVGWPFLWILSFGHAKESISPSGATNRIRMAFAERIRFRKLIFDSVLSNPKTPETSGSGRFVHRAGVWACVRLGAEPVRSRPTAHCQHLRWNKEDERSA